MDYEKIYTDLTSKKKLLDRSKVPRDVENYEYYESHHILPRSMGGSDDSTNLVLLTAREHFLAHRLLYLFTEGEDKLKMAYAWSMMCNSSKATAERNTNSKDFSKAREALSDTMSGTSLSQEVKNRISTSLAMYYSERSSPLRGTTRKPKTSTKESVDSSSLVQSKYDKKFWLVDPLERSYRVDSRLVASIYGYSPTKIYERFVISDHVIKRGKFKDYRFETTSDDTREVFDLAVLEGIVGIHVFDLPIRVESPLGDVSFSTTTKASKTFSHVPKELYSLVKKKRKVRRGPLKGYIFRLLTHSELTQELFKS